ncbi:hypothetical protein KJ673_02710 [Patescibacteria group bacterium]|nr:hypothetical protein [Patescibacteria group bacterium]MBU4452970.1 hypothetical protein [Patescibacteria group bacterium]MCG2687705.1 hypothetical protein [Candidatus Parcubacteria bacterium]
MNKRIHLFEFHELDWFPKIWRDLFTDFLSYFEATEKLYVPIAPFLLPIIKINNTFTVVDLCSGAGSPIVSVVNAISDNIDSNVQIMLTDKFPNVPALTRISKESGGRIKFIDKSVDATDVPEYLQGFRTFFSSFHHFREKSALAILSDAVNKGQGIGIFEYTERSLLLRLALFGIPLQLWLLLNTPWIRPFRWQRILWTYLIPILPVVIFWDGVVSCLRSYSESELNKLINKFSYSEYSWKVGHIKSTMPFNITYLIGYPAKKA